MENTEDDSTTSTLLGILEVEAPFLEPLLTNMGRSYKEDPPCRKVECEVEGTEPHNCSLEATEMEDDPVAGDTAVPINDHGAAPGF